MIFVLCVAWLRFFTYFLVVRDISKLLLILIAMIGDTLAFMFIVCCFILIVASVFTTLYQDTNPDKYGGLGITARYLFDAAIGQFDFSGMAGRELSFSILQIVYVFLGNILLMNYLIAILSTTYDNMKQTGIFKYKVNLYQYCERFIIAFEDKNYGEMVLHPPPISYVSSIMIPFVFSSFLMRYITMAFSYAMHWMENSFLIFGFLFFEVLLLPIAFVKVWLNIAVNAAGLVRMIINSVIWGILGLPVMGFLLVRDCTYLIRILCFHDGCRKALLPKDDMVDEVVESETRERVYN